MAGERVDSDGGGGASTVAILDDTEAGEECERTLLERSGSVIRLPADPVAVAERLGEGIGCVALNMAGGGSLDVLRALGGLAATADPVFGYAVARSAPEGFWIGLSGLARLPDLDRAAALVDSLAVLPPGGRRGKRVLTLSMDPEVLSDMRVRFGRARLSITGVFSFRQVSELLPVVRPDAAVFHLSPTSIDVFGSIVELRADRLGRDIPIVFLVDPTSNARDADYMRAGVRFLCGQRTLLRRELPPRLIEVLEWLSGAKAPADAALVETSSRS